MKKVLVTGANGQLAQELIKQVPQNIELICATRDQLNIANEQELKLFLMEHQPDTIINAAAYTAVDHAESDVDTAESVNVAAVDNLARLAGPDCYLLHISTDFVFSGEKNTPYTTEDKAVPQSVYGATKLSGEQKLMDAKPNNSAIIRTSWVYSAHGKNFVKSMLKFMSERDQLNIVIDQVGTPTWTKGLAEACWAACAGKIEGVYHWSDAGVASWYDFAEAIQKLGLQYGLLKSEVELKPIPSSGYPLPATRPAYSVLDKRKILAALPGLKNVHWLRQLEKMFKELAN